VNANADGFVAKLADLGNAMAIAQMPNNDWEIQTPDYRAPEVFLGRFV
jgi:serine/threonine protein kinase